MEKKLSGGTNSSCDSIPHEICQQDISFIDRQDIMRLVQQMNEPQTFNHFGPTTGHQMQKQTQSYLDKIRQREKFTAGQTGSGVANPSNQASSNLILSANAKPVQTRQVKKSESALSQTLEASQQNIQSAAAPGLLASIFGQRRQQTNDALSFLKKAMI